MKCNNILGAVKNVKERRSGLGRALEPIISEHCVVSRELIGRVTMRKT